MALKILPKISPVEKNRAARPENKDRSKEDNIEIALISVHVESAII